jgi:acetoin utilization deacetylase AcuC-like enzyme
MGELVSALGLPVLTVLEGGYAVDSIGRNAVEFLRGVDSN